MGKNFSSRSKRILSLLLALIMVTTLIMPTPGHAATTDNTVELAVGESTKLTGYSWFFSTTWSSSDETVATVGDDGTVTAVSVGTATVTATRGKLFGLFGGGTTTYTIIVTDGTTEALTVTEGQTLQLTVDGDDGTVSWSSSDEAVATVDENGLVTGVSEGDVTITATITKTTRKGFWFFWWGSTETTTTTETFEVCVLAGEEPVEPEPITYTVTFETNGGSAVEAQVVEEGMTATEPEAPTMEGYAFAGWYTDAELAEVYDFRTPVTGDITLYAAWTGAVLTVSFNANCEDASVSDMLEVQEVAYGEYVAEPVSPSREGYIFAGWYRDADPEDLLRDFDFQNTAITEDTVLYAGWISMNDTDGDGLVDGVEVEYGTDINKQDSDDDGLSDYIEVVILGTDPLSPDSDDDGVADGNQDDDGDGMTNAQEMEQGTNPGDNDTDADFLTDDEEIALGTDPANFDTDGDGASDGTEVRIGTDPLSADVAFEIVVSSDAEDSVKPSVQITLDGEQVDTLAVDPITDTNLFPVDMPGYLGMAYNFSVEGEFASATISFQFDASILGNGADPAIFYFNEADQTLEELETTIEGNVASAVVEHFSTYVLVDRAVYHASLTWEDVWDTDGTYDSVEVVLVIDDSGSLGGDYGYDEDTGYFTGGNDPEHLRLAAARDFVDNSTNSAKIGIVKFDGVVDIFSELLTCDEAGKDTLKNLLHITPDIYGNTDYDSSGVFDSRGYTYMYSGIDAAFELFSSVDRSERSVLQVVIVFTDGVAHDEDMHDGVVAEANDLGIRIYTVGLGSSTSYFTDYLQPLAEETGGSFYMTSDADQLVEIYEDIGKKIDIETDTDGDGISDYYEENMIAFNGTKIPMDKTQKDTDGDGLEDGEEVEVELVYNEDHTKVYVKGKIHSYPHLTDSDNDSIHDYHDPDPMSFTITDRVLSWVEGLSYSNLTSYVGHTVGYAIDHGATINGISDEYVKYLRDAIIVGANDSGVGYWKDFWDSGLGCIALKFVRKGDSTAVVFALRGTEPGSDLANDAAADVVLGVGWDCEQSRNAFSAYKKIATNKKYDYYVTGHSLGGRLAQDVIYKTYNANEGGWFKEKADIPVPVHSVTFNALGYNKIVYATLENDLLKSYKSKLTNYYNWLDLVGEGLGCSGIYKRAGTDVRLFCRDIEGNYYRDEEFDNWFNVRDCDYHGINYFHSDYDLLYANSDAPSKQALPGSIVRHDFSYWVD